MNYYFWIAVVILYQLALMCVGCKDLEQRLYFKDVGILFHIESPRG